MSASRRSFPGIAQAWIARGGGVQKPFAFNAKTISALCNIDFLGDINATLTFGLVCDVNEPPPNITHDLNVICSTTFLGDINPIIDMTDVFVVVVVSTPP